MPGALPQSTACIVRDREAGLHLGAQFYVARGGEVVADIATGESKPGVPLRPDAVMLWLSAGKPITAMAIARQWELGRLQLDHPVARFLPEFGRNGKNAITIHHLLTHTAGFRSADQLPEDIEWTEAVARICEAPLEPGWPPGEKAGYQSTASWYVLGEIVRRLDGRDFNRYVRAEIFEPLGMIDSWLGMPAAQYQAYGNRIGVMHVKEPQGLVPHPIWNSERGCGRCRPGGNFRAPARDLGRFYRELLAIRRGGPSKLWRPETVRVFTERHRIGLFDQTFRHTLDFGLGFIICSNRYGPDTVPYGYGRHASDAAFGHSGSQSSCAFADPEHDLIVAWVFDGLPGERLHQMRARELNTAIYEDLALASATPKGTFT